MRINLGTGIAEATTVRPSYGDIFEYARVMDADGFLRFMAAQADEDDLGDLLEAYAVSEASRMGDYFALREMWRTK